MPEPGCTGPAGDRMLTAVQGERRRRCSSLLDSFLRSDAEDRPTSVALTSFVRDGDGAPTSPLCADCSLSKTGPGGRVCAFESVWGRWQRVLQYDRGAASSTPFVRRTAGRRAHEGGRKEQPVNHGTFGWIGCTRSGSARPAGDRTPNRVGEERRRRFFPPWLLSSF